MFRSTRRPARGRLPRCAPRRADARPAGHVPHARPARCSRRAPAVFAALVGAALVAAAAPPAARAGGLLALWRDGGTLGNGWGVALARRIVALPVLSAEVRGSWFRFADAPVTVDAFPVEATARLSQGLAFVGAGVGYTLLSADSGAIDNATTYHVVAGVELAPGGFGAMLEARYTFLDTRADFGHVDGDGLGVSAGVLFNW